jgi:abortive infection bacteriophage resistance protein
MFDKTAISIGEQIIKLQERGLIVTENDNAAHYLSHISYYRLGEYWHSMQDDKEHLFKQNSKFKDVISLYNFDAELRILLFGVIEKIEISLRTKLIYLSQEITMVVSRF